MKQRLPAWLLLAASVTFVCYLTLRPTTDNVSGIDPFCGFCGERGLADLLLNIVLFVPFGAALAGLRAPWRRAGLISVIAASGIEVAQIAIPGRSPTWRDVAMNGGGGALGALLAVRVPRLMRSAAAPQLAVASAGVAVGAVWLTGWLLQPSAKSSTWYGLLAPRLARLEHWPGTVDQVRVGDYPIETGQLSSGAAVREALRARHAISITGRLAAPTTDLSPIVMLSDEMKEEMLLVGQDGEDAILRERRRASGWRLTEPEHRFVGVFEGRDGSAFALTVWPALASACATLDGREHCAAPFAASSLWTLLYWRRAASASRQSALGALTFALLWLPIGLFGAAIPRLRLLLLLTVTGAGVWTTTLVTGLASPAWWEAIAALCGFAIGLLFAVVALRRAR